MRMYLDDMQIFVESSNCWVEWSCDTPNCVGQRNTMLSHNNLMLIFRDPETSPAILVRLPMMDSIQLESCVIVWRRPIS